MAQPPMQSTQICRYFASTGNCFYGNQCNYAHIRPNEGDFPPLSSPVKPNKSSIPCRNIAVHGYCKFQGKGCEYNHDIDAIKKLGSEYGMPSVQSLNFNDQPQGQSPPGVESPYLEHATNGVNKNLFPTFTPNRASTGTPPTMNAPTSPTKRTGGPVYFYNPNGSDPNASQGSQGTTSHFSNPSTHHPHHFPPLSHSNPNATPTTNVPTGGGPATTAAIVGSALQYNNPPILLPNPHLTLKPQYGKRRMNTFFMSEDLRKELQRKGHMTYHQLDLTDPRRKGLPTVVHRYHSLFPLDDAYGGVKSPSSSVFGYNTSLYKCFSSADGLPYVIRKIEGFRLANEQPLRMGEIWKQVHHPSITTLSEIFISKDFGDVNAVFFAYQYHACAETLESTYLLSGGPSHPTDFIQESVLWTYITQIVSAIRAVHTARLACRSIVPSKIIITAKNRVKLSGCAVNDVVNYDPSKNITNYQYEDMVALGHLIVTLCCKTPTAVQNLNKSLDFIQMRYSPEMKNLVVYLLAKPTAMGPYPNIDEVVSMLATKFVIESEQLHNQSDLLENELAKELENGRLFRLLGKMGFINERPEFDMDPSWSETGDRYLLKLFRDYVFHQVYEDGSPVVDYAHVVECLNKLDAGVDEKIVLTSRDEQSVLVVSYKDLKRCMLESFTELTTKKTTTHYPSSIAPYGQYGSYSGGPR